MNKNNRKTFGFEGMVVGSPAFNAQWKNQANNNTQNFGNAQGDFILNSGQASKAKNFLNNPQYLMISYQIIKLMNHQKYHIKNTSICMQKVGIKWL